eukprot:COSAG01_NODE_608_length_14865_cov_5.517879_19_plen_39_part_00
MLLLLIAPFFVCLFFVSNKKALAPRSDQMTDTSARSLR